MNNETAYIGDFVYTGEGMCKILFTQVKVWVKLATLFEGVERDEWCNNVAKIL